MSTNSNFKQNKCWSCEFFSGKREYKKGWFGDSVETDDLGTCTNQKNYLHKNQKVLSSGWCSCYQKWGVLQSAIAMQEQKKAQEQAGREQRQAFERQERENQRQQEELWAERFRLEAERKRLEYERWYNSLSEEERKQEDERKEQERLKAEELRKQREEEYKRQEEQRRIKESERKRKIKQFGFVGAAIAIIIAIIIACVSIGANCSKQQAFSNSNTGKFLSYLNENLNFNNDKFYISTEREDGSTFYYWLEYKKNGWVDNYGRTCDFRAIGRLSPRESEHFEQMDSFFFFNLQGSDNADSFHDKGYPNFCSRTFYNSKSVLSQFQSVKFNITTNLPEYGGVYYEYDSGFSNSEHLDEWTSRSWLACELAYKGTNSLFQSALGKSILA